jgi:glycosyltransferase involved in cell wall biosynthesis
MKNLLMIVPFFPPNAGGGVYRTLAFVKYLERYGWSTTVISPRPESFWIVDDSLSQEVPSSCRVLRTNTLNGQYVLSLLGRRRKVGGRAQVRSSRKFSFMRRLSAFALVPDTYVGWYPFAVRTATRVLREGVFDVFYSTATPETSHLVAQRLRRISGLPWVADFRDPWMNLHLLPTPTTLHKRLHARLERNVCEDASVIVTSQWHHDMLEDRYPAMRRITVITNGYDASKLEKYENLQPDGERLKILHAGMLTQKRSAVPFLEGLRLFFDRQPEAESRCSALFLGPRESENDAAVGELGLGDIVEFRDTVSHHESLQLERMSHILLLIKHSNPVYRGIVPGKLYEYVGARRPILALVPDGEVKSMIHRLNRGETAPPDNPREIASQIGRMYQLYVEGALHRAYDLSPVTEFDRARLTGRLAEYLNSVVNEKDRA